MSKRIRTRLLIIAGVTLLSIFLFAGFPPSRANMHDRIRLGLDLRGGTHLVLQVVTDDAVRAESDQAIETVRQNLQKDNVLFRQLTRTAINKFQAIGVDPNKDNDFRRIVTDRLPEWDIVSTSGEVPNTYTVQLKAPQEQSLRDQAVDQAINTIRNRVDQLGVGEINIQKHVGADEIVVQMPGVTDTARVKGIMQSTALLEFKLVDSGPFTSPAAAAQQYGGMVPAN